MSNTTSITDLLIAHNCESLVRKDDTQEKTLEALHGKTHIGILFSASWSKLCTNFAKKLVPVYNHIGKATGGRFQIIFISDDERLEEFQSSMESMPWLAVPFTQKTVIAAVTNHFGVQRLPGFTVIAADGKEVVPLQAGERLITRFGSAAFPFTNEHIEKLEAAEDARAKELPQEVKHESHEHTLRLVNDPYKTGIFGCDICKDQGSGWAYQCTNCSYDVHPTCANPGFVLTRTEEEVAEPEVAQRQTTAEAGGLFDWLYRLLNAFRLFILILFGSIHKLVARTENRKESSSSSSSSSE